MKMLKLGRVPEAPLSKVTTLVNRTVSKNKAFYNSARWRDVRLAKLARDPMCQRCAYLGIETMANEVNHVIPIAAGGHKTDPNNLCSCCRPCHSIATAHEKRNEPVPPFAPSKPVTYSIG